ncbi:Protein PLANT CADMIUM RESISTANCE 8 [Rhynchospora pubera]|uniref:Protein PLANT CADMIUM RESISTANCE 8 n=1 Tax=Rhynchospora pubera TaxID=906938 RepID=A0AAV8HJX7_9POAL|nr:Protein PLANT CADMIUM RESISTANCE 8 [Rhynchospora pubera]
MPHSSTSTDQDTYGHFRNSYEDASEVEAPMFTRSSFSFNQRSEMEEAVEVEMHNEIKLPPSNHQNSEIEEMNEVKIQTDAPSYRKRLMDFIPVYIPAVEEGAIVHGRKEARFLDFLRAAPSKEWFMTGQWLPRRRAARNGSQVTNDNSSTEPANTNPRNRFHVPFVRKIKWRSFGVWFKKWIKDPSNIALVIWLVAVAIGLFMLFLIMIGALNSEIPSSSRRSKWSEVINQILNALFTIMCVYQHPRLFHHLILLLRWRSEDREEVRKIYSKGNWPKPRERATMLFVVFLLHLTCCAQYFCCALFWAYKREDRPDWPLNIGYGVGIVAPIIAGLLTAYGPLARQRETESDDIEGGGIQSQNGNHNSTVVQLDQSELMIYNRTIVVTRPEWIGGLFDCWDDLTVFFLSSLCTLCVFGWNMERLGMGNMYVHIATFVLLFIAPLLIFSVTALNIDNYTIRYAVGIVGIVLCLFALLYGGFWRIQMRKRFKLPGNPHCCGQPSVTDCLQWQFCWACSLAQEVRTGNFYDIGDDMFYTTATNEEHRVVLVPLPRDGASFMNSRSFSCPPKIEPNYTSSGEKVNGDSSHVFPNSLERVATYGGNQALRPPLVPLMQLEK